MKKIAIISDIHSNIVALKAVLEDIKKHDVTAIYCLGDVIGYGPNPIESLDEVYNVCEVVLLGNHEEAVLTQAIGFNFRAKEAVNWTREQLKPSWLNISKTRNRWKILQKLPLIYREDDFLFVHGSPRDPTMEYILKSDTQDLFGDVPEKIREIIEQTEKVCFVGHTHIPGIITEDSQWYDVCEFSGVWKIRPGERIICNVGAVGQPRDKDKRACYVTITSDEIFYHRVEYNVKEVQKCIRKITQLHNSSADRLEIGR